MTAAQRTKRRAVARMSTPRCTKRHKMTTRAPDGYLLVMTVREWWSPPWMRWQEARI